MTLKWKKSGLKKITSTNNIDNKKTVLYTNWYNINGELIKRVEYVSKSDSLVTEDTSELQRFVYGYSKGKSYKSF